MGNEIKDSQSETGQGPTRILTTEEQAIYKKYLMKVDLMIIPIYFVIYWLAILDRNNIGTANVAGFTQELKLVGNQFNWISASLFYTYIFFEIPSTILLQKFGVSKWLPSISILWGVTCMCMAAVKSYGTAIVVRLFLGIFEAGFVPGFLYYSTIWYPNVSRMPRIALFFSAGTFAGIFAGPIAKGLTKVNGSLKEYQYIFLFEGAMTVVVAFIAYFVLHDYPEKTKYISPEELAVANKMFESDQIGVSTQSYTLSQKLHTLLDIKLWCFGTIFAIGAIGGATQAIFGPTLISQIGYKDNQALVMSSIPSACGFGSQVLLLLFPFIIKRSKMFLLLIFYASVAAVFYILLAFNKGKKSRVIIYAFL
ncbi:putative tartrate transporter [Smittium mucronatum]|uniref:Putative tartrate transporter n=1 Tax=Smittium mucronatum TaxID=133383 RepID=A0A1R0H5S0_9FUNG|nr:putative tartrate transporter [Smittium mucronatum]